MLVCEFAHRESKMPDAHNGTGCVRPAFSIIDRNMDRGSVVVGVSPVLGRCVSWLAGLSLHTSPLAIKRPFMWPRDRWVTLTARRGKMIVYYSTFGDNLFGSSQQFVPGDQAIGPPPVVSRDPRRVVRGVQSLNAHKVMHRKCSEKTLNVGLRMRIEHALFSDLPH